jgi:TolB-like protein/Flp pilus assembly protein TadD
MTPDFSEDRLSDKDHECRPPDSEVRVQIERILKSKPFAASERLQRFLSWTVEQVLHGEAQNIKQFTIGQEVFDRGSAFDPRTDSIVRTEAQRLRRKLSEYYRGEGHPDSILVSFEAGSYVPIVKTRAGPHSRKRTEAFAPVPVSKRPPTIAVLPFLNLTGYADQEYLCRGIAESVQARLANLPRLKIISTYSAFRFATGDQDVVANAGRELGADTIVEGSIQMVGSRIRVHTKVLDVSSGSFVWAWALDGELQDLLAIQDEIARAVAEALIAGLPESRRIASAPDTNAYRVYLRGRHFWNKLTVEGCEQAAECFLRTISIAPEYAEAYAALAEAYHWLIFLGARNPSRLAGMTRRLALQALRLDTNCAEGYIALAVATGIFQWRWNEAEALFRRGLELRPNYGVGYLQRAFCRLETGGLEESRSDIERALDLDPLSPRSHRGTGLLSYLKHDFANAVSAFDRALELGPDIESTHYLRGLALLGAGRTDEAIASINQSLEPSTSGMRLGALVAAYAAGDYRRKAAGLLEKLHQLFAKGSASPIAFVHAYAALGQTSKALDWLERAANERCTGLMLLKLHPLYESLRDEARFRAVLEGTNLT